MHTLPDLPYGYGDLEPYIDAQTMEIHHSKHHKAYVDKLNTAIEKHPSVAKALEGKPELEALGDLLKNLDSVPEDIRMAVRNNGGGHLNHSFFWTVMHPPAGGNGEGEPTGDLAGLINGVFGDFATFKTKFSDAATGFFGSGWIWLVLDNPPAGEGKLAITGTKDHANPKMEGQVPLLTLDVWEHAYYLKYQNRRPEYIENWWHVVNWNAVAKNFEGAKK